MLCMWGTYRISHSRSGGDQTLFALIVNSILFAHEILRTVNPLLFPTLLPEVLKFKAWMKY